MACNAQILHAPATSQSWTNWTMGALKNLWQTYREHRQARATAALLHSLNDRTLDDIGIDRSEIDSVVRTRSLGRRINYRPVWE
jgi:uncharacterized protein YjiS (DUF1127 family)